MSSSQVHFAGREFWIHDGVAEVWFAAIADEAKANFRDVDWLQEMIEKAEEALSHNWVVALMDIFDRYISQDRLELFRVAADAVNARLFSIAAIGESVKVREFQAAANFLLPEIEMLHFLLFDQERVLVPPRIFTLAAGWKIA